MKIICVVSKLKEAIDNGERIITKNLTLPILNNLLLRTEKNNLIVSSTNLEVGVHSWLSCKIIEGGEMTIPAKLLSGIVSNLKNGNIELETKKGKGLIIKADNYKGEIKGQDAQDFPIIPKITKDHHINLSAQELADSLSQVIPFTSISETRPEITGVLFKKEKNQEFISLVSTDSFRLSEKKIFLKNKFKSEEFSFIIPQKTAAEALRLSHGKEEVNIIINKNQISFQFPQNELVSRLIEGNYPDYSSFVPTEFKTELIADREELIKTIKLVSLLSSRINDITFSNNSSKKGMVSVFASDSDLGENSAFLKAEIKGDPLEISFNWHYLLEGLLHTKGKKVIMKFTEKTKPTLVKSTEDTNYIYIVMPIRV
jgi:DNA polymerase-3 subunit beta